MTRVAISLTDPLALRAEGHATGSPEACAAVSTLVYTLDGALDDKGVRHERSITPGSVLISCRRCDAAAAVFDVVASGFLLLARDFGAYVSVQIEK